MITTVQCSICTQLNNKHRVVVKYFRLHHTCSIIILWLHSLSGVIRSLLCNPRTFSSAIIIKWVELARNRNKWLHVGANTTSVYPCRSCEIPRAHVRAITEKMRNYHQVARTCDNEVGVVIIVFVPVYIAVHEPV